MPCRNSGDNGTLMSHDPLQREKTYEALAYFASHTRKAGELKLYKLLFYLDLLNFRRTGIKVTDLNYQAWPLGPVPPKLYHDVHDPSSALHDHFEITAARQIDHTEAVSLDSDEDSVAQLRSGIRRIPASFRPKIAYEHRYLTRRELKIAELLAEIFYDVDAATMSDVSHKKFGPWRKAIQRAKQSGETRPEIDFLEGVVAAGDPKEELPIEELRLIIKEREAVLEALR